MTKAFNVELRKDDRGEFDELIANNCMFHAEMMSDNQLWIGISDAKDEVLWMMTVTAKGKLSITAEQDWP